jgi:hypothetical protein
MRINRKYFLLCALGLALGQLALTVAAQNVAPTQMPPDVTSQGASQLTSQAAATMSAMPSVQQLRSVPGHPNAEGWINPDFRLHRMGLHTLYIEPIKVQAAADSPYRDLSPSELATLNQQFRIAVAGQLPPNLKLVAAPQPDSMLVGIVLQHSEMKKDGFHLRNYTPIGFLVSHAKAAVGVSKISFERMRVEVNAHNSAGTALFVLNLKPQGIAADPGSALTPADADPNQVPMSPVRLDQMPTYLAAKVAKFQMALQALAA